MTDLAMPADTDLAQEAVALVRRWLREASSVPVGGSAAQLAGLLRDPKGLAFAVGFVDGVVRPEDLKVSARALAALAPDVPRFLPAPLRAAVRVGGRMAPIMGPRIGSQKKTNGMRLARRTAPRARTLHRAGAERLEDLLLVARLGR